MRTGTEAPSRPATDDPHGPGPRVASLIAGWRTALKEARNAGRAFEAAAAMRDAGRPIRSPLINALTAALFEIAGDESDFASEHAALCESELAAALRGSGPVADGADRLEGVDLGGLLRVLRTPLDFTPPVADACTDDDGGGRR